MRLSHQQPNVGIKGGPPTTITTRWELPNSLVRTENKSSVPKVSILLVDDTPANLLALRTILEELDQNLIEATSGLDALKCLEQEDIAVILLDVQMPGLNGFETAKLMRQQNSRRIPIIFLTAFESDDFPVDQAYALGAVDYLVKPLIPIIVRAKVAGFVELYTKTLQIQQQAEQLRVIERQKFDRSFEEQREWFRVALSSIGDAVITTDINGLVTFLNPIAAGLTEWTEGDAKGQLLGTVFQILNERTRQPIENPVATVLREGRVVGLGKHTILVSKTGATKPIENSAAPILDATGTLLGVVLIFRDVTEQRRAEQEVRESEQRFRQLADAMPQIVWTAGPDGRIDYMNRKWQEFTGLPETLGNEGWGEILHPDEVLAANERWAKSVQTGQPFEMEMRLLDRNIKAYRWYLVRTVGIHDSSGKVIRWFGTGTDIHGQKRAEESARYLAEASAALASVVDYKSTLEIIAKLAVPYFADWSAVDVANEDGSLSRLAVAHLDADKIRSVHELMQQYPPDEDSPGGAIAVLRSGKPEIIKEITDDMLVRSSKDEQHLNLIRSLGLKSYICVPLIVSGHRLGVLTFATAESGRIYNDADLAVATDLSQRAAIAIENTRLYGELREADRRKDVFLATLAHELRNPLAPIRNSLQILKMPGIDTQMVERSREMMERQLHHLVRLVDDLLDVSRVMRGKIELRRERIELATVIARAIETVQPLVDADSHELIVQLSSESLPIDADPVRVSQIIGNLLANAAKYTESNGRIWLTSEREGKMAVVRIRDNGIGIADSMLPRIFELFVQVDNTSTKAQGGLGIGLTLVKNLVQMHDGTVEAKSDGLGYGSEFVVRLPISEEILEEGEQLEKEKHALERSSPSGRQLLVVDDNQDAANSLATLLRLQGHEVRVAYSGVAAIEMTKSYFPTMVFLDIGMPAMDGLEVARRLKQQPGFENVVLVALTGWGQQEDRKRTAEAGFLHHLVKPLEPKIVERLLTDLK